MTLPESGLITAAMINEELLRSSNAPFSINGTDERKLAEVLSGPIRMSDFYGAALGDYELTVGEYDNAEFGFLAEGSESYFYGDFQPREVTHYPGEWIIHWLAYALVEPPSTILLITDPTNTLVLEEKTQIVIDGVSVVFPPGDPDASGWSIVEGDPFSLQSKVGQVLGVDLYAAE